MNYKCNGSKKENNGRGFLKAGKATKRE